MSGSCPRPAMLLIFLGLLIVSCRTVPVTPTTRLELGVWDLNEELLYRYWAADIWHGTSRSGMSCSGGYLHTEARL